MKSILKNIIVSICSILVCFLFLEVGIRLTIKSAKKVKWKDRPLFYYIPPDAQSLRAISFDSKKDPDVFRVGVLGDSFSFAPYMQFDDAFPKKLERMLNLEGKRKVEVINFGVPGYSTSHEVGQANRFIKEGGFDLVILQMTLNDLEVKPIEPEGITTLINPYERFDVTSWKNPFLKNLKSLGFIASKIHNHLVAKAYKNYYFDLYSNKKAQELFNQSINQLSSMLSASNTPLVAAIFPLFGHDLDENYPFNKMHNYIHETLNKENIPFIDLFNAYRGSHYERLTVLPGEDFHPNEIAHRMAAEEIYLWLVKTKKIPEEVIIKNIVKQRVQITLEKAPKTQAELMKGRYE